MILTFVVLVLMKKGQPALLYLVPCTLITASLVAWRRKEMKKFWKGSSYQVCAYILVTKLWHCLTLVGNYLYISKLYIFILKGFTCLKVALNLSGCPKFFSITTPLLVTCYIITSHPHCNLMPKFWWLKIKVPRSMGGHQGKSKQHFNMTFQNPHKSRLHER